MRGGPSLKGKGGLVGFRRSLKGKGGLVGFRRSLKVQGSTCSFSKVQETTFIFFEYQQSTFRLSKNLLSIKRGFSKAFFKPYFLKNTIFLNYK